MNEEKMHLINKLFKGKNIRTIWSKEDEKYYVSVVDVVGVLSESSRPRKYWSDLKKKLYDEGSEVSDKIGQLKLKSEDGKYRLTDVTDIEGMFRIIESIPSKNAEPIKLWLVKLGSERIDEVFDPSLALQRAMIHIVQKGMMRLGLLKELKRYKKENNLLIFGKKME